MGSLAVGIVYRESTFGNIASIFGLSVSLLGFVVTIWTVRDARLQIKEAGERAERAIVEAKVAVDGAVNKIAAQLRAADCAALRTGGRRPAAGGPRNPVAPSELQMPGVPRRRISAGARSALDWRRGILITIGGRRPPTDSAVYRKQSDDRAARPPSKEPHAMHRRHNFPAGADSGAPVP